MKSVSCPNRECPLSRDAGAGSIILHGFYQTNSGKRRRYLCRICEKTFCSNTGTPYYRLQHRRATFDEVATLSVEGLNKSAIARVKRIAHSADYVLEEGKRVSVASSPYDSRRPEPGPDVNRGEDPDRMFFVADDSPNLVCLKLLDGEGSYFRSLNRRQKWAAFSSQPSNGIPHDRIVKVQRRAVIGAAWRLEERLRDSEDSSKLNTPFVERLNLTIRQGSAYLSRRTICQALWKDCLEDHLELLRCHYNFVRSHMALKFGREMRTPAIQAGVTTRRLNLREIFLSPIVFSAAEKVTSVFVHFSILFIVEDKRLPMAA
jgi:hypothetical protein